MLVASFSKSSSSTLCFYRFSGRERSDCTYSCPTLPVTIRQLQQPCWLRNEQRTTTSNGEWLGEWLRGGTVQAECLGKNFALVAYSQATSDPEGKVISLALWSNDLELHSKRKENIRSKPCHRLWSSMPKLC
jgi:hypothetical protein